MTNVFICGSEIYPALYGSSGIGIIERKIKNGFIITKESWASGIWAGMENVFIRFDDNIVQINKIDLDKRKINYKTNPHQKDSK